MMPRYVVLIVFLAYCKEVCTAQLWSPYMVSNYFGSRNIYSVNSIVCSVKDSVHIIKHFTAKKTTGYLTSSRVLNSLEPSHAYAGKIGIFIDLSCAHNKHLIVSIKNETWFPVNITWLIWDQEEFLSQLNWALPLSIYSDVIVINRNNLVKLRKLKCNFPTETLLVGYMDKKSRLYFFMPTQLKINYNMTEMRAAITYVQDIYNNSNIAQRLVDWHFKPGFDIINRFYYSNILLLSHLYNYSLKLVPTDTWGDRFDNGTWTGILGLFQADKADLTITPMLPLKIRMEVATPTIDLVPYWFAAIFRQPRALGTYKAMILELSPSAWACVGGMVIMGGLVLLATQKYEPPTYWTSDNDRSVGMVVLQMAGIMSEQGLSLVPQRLSSRIACITLLLVGLILTTYYGAATMTALLSQEAPYIKSMEQLLSSKIPIRIRNASIIYHPKVRRRLFTGKLLDMMDQPDIFTDLCAGIRSILNGYAFIDEYFAIFPIINEQLKSDLLCDLTVFNSARFPYLVSYVKKDHHFREMHVRGLLRLLEHGLTQIQRQHWTTDRLRCSRISQFVHVQLEAVSAALVLILAGVFLSLIILIVEKLLARKDYPPKIDIFIL